MQTWFNTNRADHGHENEKYQHLLKKRRGDLLMKKTNKDQR